VSTPDLQELARTSSFVFSGTVQQEAASNVSVVEATEQTILVRIERPLRIAPELGDLSGRVVTVATEAPDELPPGTGAVFFADSWVHGNDIAVRERAHVAPDLVDEVAAAVERLPDLHLQDRLRDARAVVEATVARVVDVPGMSLERRSPRWAEAILEIGATLKGNSGGLRLFFPTSESHHWYGAPSFTTGQACVVLLHVGDPLAGHWLEGPEYAGAATALDPADAQPADATDHVRELLAEIGG
jgi:hypothetical protein